MRLYLDSNVYAHADDLGQGRDLVEWLVDSGHEAVLSEIHLAEALAIPDVVAREGRLTLLAAVPARVSRPLASLQAEEFVQEAQRLRPAWSRQPVGDLSDVNDLLTAYEEGWKQLQRDPSGLLELTGDYQAVSEQAIRGSRAGQKIMREDLLAGVTKLTELDLGGERIPVGPLDLSADDDFCRFESCLSWFQALVLAMPTLAELRDYTAPYVDETAIDARDFARFWAEDVELIRLPRGLATSMVMSEQRRSKIKHGNVADARHAGYILDADVFVTEDNLLFRALQRVVSRLAGGATPVLVLRAADLIGGLSATVGTAPGPPGAAVR
jgi:hypothetical protein